MNKFEPTAEDIKKPEAQENLESPKGVENPEALRKKFISQSEKEVDSFKKESANDLLQAETRAEKDGLSIDGVDKEELQSLDLEADNAKLELETVLTPPPLPEEIITKKEESEKASFCHECGKPMQKGAKFCTECGAKLMQKDSRGAWSSDENMPPPLPEEYLKSFPPPLPNTPPLPEEYLRTIPPPLPNTPPPLPEEYLKSVPPPLPENNTHESIRIDETKLVECLKLSKIKDPDESLKRLMDFTGTNTKQELLLKLDEKDEYGDPVVDMVFYSPETLNDFDDPSIELIQKIRQTGDALGYTYMNTPEYRNKVDALIDKLNRDGKKEEALQAGEIFKNLEVEFENEKSKSSFQKIDDGLFEIAEDKERLSQYVDNIKNLSPDSIVYLYHGFRSGEYDGALTVLNSESKGVKQGTGPTLSLLPVGGYWNGVGLRYAIRRDQIDFPGEENPKAVVSMLRGNDGIEDTGFIISESGSLPIDQFEADVMRSKFTLPNPELEKELVEKMKHFAELRKNSQRENI